MIDRVRGHLGLSPTGTASPSTALVPLAQSQAERRGPVRLPKAYASAAPDARKLGRHVDLKT